MGLSDWIAVGENVRVDLIVSEIRLVLAEAETAKPPADIHGRAPHGLSV